MGARSEVMRAFERSQFVPRVVTALSARAIMKLWRETDGGANPRKRFHISISNNSPTPDFHSPLLPLLLPTQPHPPRQTAEWDKRGNAAADGPRKLAHPI